MSCLASGIPPLGPYNPLIGCDGKRHSNDFLKSRLEKALKEEDYEEAKIFHEELKRRGIVYNPLK
jgi:hypothetical protein